MNTVRWRSGSESTAAVISLARSRETRRCSGVGSDVAGSAGVVSLAADIGTADPHYASGTQDRLLSGVYYFHREPKAFSGGALRFHRFGGGETQDDWIDVEPEQDSLVVFPTWARHEVLRVSCPSREFADSRFAVNVWLCRALT